MKKRFVFVLFLALLMLTVLVACGEKETTPTSGMSNVTTAPTTEIQPDTPEATAPPTQAPTQSPTESTTGSEAPTETNPAATTPPVTEPPVTNPPTTEPPATTPTNPPSTEPTAPPATEAPHIHNFIPSVTTAATCSKNGIMTYSCSCGNSYTEGLPATSHKPVTVKGSLPTASSAGLTDGQKCETCKEVLVAQEVIPAGTNHIDISFPGGYITSSDIVITTEHLEFHIPAGAYVPDDLVENANIITNAIETVTGLSFEGNPEYGGGKVPVYIIRHPGGESGPALAYSGGVEMCPADLLEYSALIHECSHMIQFRQSGWCYEQIAMEGVSTYTEYKVRAYVAQNYPDLLQYTKVPEYTFYNYDLSYEALYAHDVEYWFENILTESSNANYSIGLRFMRYLETVYGSYTKWFLDYQQYNPYQYQSSDRLSVEEQLKAFQLAYGEDVFDGFYPWLRQNEAWFKDPYVIEEPLNETAIKKVQLYPYWTSDTFHECTLAGSSFYAEYEDLFVGIGAARYYIETYKGKNADGLSLTARFAGMLYFYDTQGNLLRVETSSDVWEERKFDLSGVSIIKLGGKVSVRTFWLEGF